MSKSKGSQKCPKTIQQLGLDRSLDSRRPERPRHALASCMFQPRPSDIFTEKSFGMQDSNLFSNFTCSIKLKFPLDCFQGHLEVILKQTLL